MLKSDTSKIELLKIALRKSHLSSNALDKLVSVKSTSCKLQFKNLVDFSVNLLKDDNFNWQLEKLK